MHKSRQVKVEEDISDGNDGTGMIDDDMPMFPMDIPDDDAGTFRPDPPYLSLGVFSNGPSDPHGVLSGGGPLPRRLPPPIPPC